MLNSIAISPKYGVNPSILKCFWCGESMGIALCGKIKGDKKAPNNVINGYEPCEKCQKLFSQGILGIGVQKTPPREDFPPISKDADGSPLYPNGSHVVLTEQWVRRVLDDQMMIDKVLKQRAMYMPTDIVHQIIEDANKLIEEEREYEDRECGTPPD